jgi:hypothetical protein
MVDFEYSNLGLEGPVLSMGLGLVDPGVGYTTVMKLLSVCSDIVAPVQSTSDLGIYIDSNQLMKSTQPICLAVLRTLRSI